MSKLKYIKGDLLELAWMDGMFDVIVHGCNCQCLMGGGIAKLIRERFPQAAEADYATEAGDIRKLGGWTSAEVRSFVRSFIIINAYTQYTTSNTKDVFEYTAFKLILQKLAHIYGHASIGLPYIGMGLAGGDASIIIPMIEDFAITVSKTGGSVTLVEYDKH